MSELGPEEQRLVEALFDEASRLPVADREAYVERQATSDVVRAEVSSLLRHFDTGNLPEIPEALRESTEADRTGTSLAHYELVRPIGRGGMGVVYAARDTKLDREVAMKVLPRDLAGREELRARFEREAKAVASLSHPNIVTVHSFESSNGDHFITMELVDGMRLSDLVAPGGIAIERFLDVALKVVEAVAAAHRQGITHRDLKPDNVMITRDGHVKVLDFGLAKLKEGLRSDLQGPADELTREGKIMGTVAYLSPEQAEGKATDERTDVFALGIVFYEMLVGSRPFLGDSNVSVISSILKETPTPVTELKQSLPPQVARVIRRCLEKDPDRRYQHALDLRNDLEEIRDSLGDAVLASDTAPSASTVAAEPKSGVPWPAFAALLLLGGAIGVLAMSLVGGGRTSTSDPRADAVLTQVTDLPGIETEPSISPEGRMIAYAGDADGNFDIYLQRIGGRNAQNLTENSPADDTSPAFSPDGERIAFRSERDGGGIFVMGATGESVRRLTEDGYDPVWCADNKCIVYSTERIEDPSSRFTVSQLWRVDTETGTNEMIFKGDAVQPHVSPNGHRIAYWAIDGGARDIWTIAADGTDPRPVTQDPDTDWEPVWSPDGRYLYYSSDRSGRMDLWRVAIDEKTGALRGKPEPVTSGTEDAIYPSPSRDGSRIAHVVSSVRGEVIARPFDPVAERFTGPGTVVIEGTGSVPKEYVHCSHDGKWLTYGSQGAREDIFVLPTDGSVREHRQLTNDTYKDRRPRWSPDGQRIAFYSNRSGTYEVWIVNRDGSGLRQVTDMAGVSLYNPTWSPDGRRIAAHGHVLADDAQRVYVTSVETPAPEALPAWPDEGTFFELNCWSDDPDVLIGFVRDQATGRQLGIATFTISTGTYETLVSEPCRDWTVPSLPGGDRILALRGGRLSVIHRKDRAVRDCPADGPIAAHAVAVGEGGRTLYLVGRRRESDIWLLTRPTP